jgi:creatinine amidohydrolase
MDRILIEDYTWRELRQLLERAELRTAVIMVGSTEQHGPHLPECTDALLAQVIGEALARRLDRALLAPTIRVGCSDHHMAFPGTISLRQETLAALLADYVSSLARHGFKNIIVVPTHGGNFAAVAAAAEAARAALPEVTIIDFSALGVLASASAEASAQFGVSAAAAGAHAGEWETSLVIAVRPDLVHMDQAVMGFMSATTDDLAARVFNEGIGALSKDGVLGDPRSATAEKGRVYLGQVVDMLVHFVSERLR